MRLGRGEIEVSVEPTTTWDALSYKEPIASDVEPILFPWGGVRAQTYKFDGAKFTKAKEITQREQTPRPSSPRRRRRRRGPPVARSPAGAADAEGRPRAAI